ncbi:hypothetical protein FQA39_LY11993 [Lamprigera yunnana]|nr:hypothetical protein FQA39_LY11993 [Lamprigera yunnana]
MDSLYHQTNKLVQQTQECFQKLESKSKSHQEIEAEIQQKINSINSNCEKLDTLLFKVPLAHRQNVKMNCDQLKYDSRHLQAALTSWQQKQMRKQLAATEREQLLGQRFTSNPELTTINIDYALQHQNSLYNSHRGMDEMLQTGSGTLESLRMQRTTLKGAHRRIVEMANTLGLSNYTMRLIERRVVEDKYILVGDEIPAETVVFVNDKERQLMQLKRHQQKRVLKIFIIHMLDTTKVKLSTERENYYCMGDIVFKRIQIRGVITGINVVSNNKEMRIYSVDDGTGSIDCFLMNDETLEELRIKTIELTENDVTLLQHQPNNNLCRAALMMLQNTKEKFKMFLPFAEFSLGNTVEVIGKLTDYKEKRNCFVQSMRKVSPIHNSDYYEHLNHLYQNIYSHHMKVE